MLQITWLCFFCCCLSVEVLLCQKADISIDSHQLSIAVSWDVFVFMAIQKHSTSFTSTGIRIDRNVKCVMHFGHQHFCGSFLFDNQLKESRNEMIFCSWFPLFSRWSLVRDVKVQKDQWSVFIYSNWQRQIERKIHFIVFLRVVSFSLSTYRHDDSIFSTVNKEIEVKRILFIAEWFATFLAIVSLQFDLVKR